MAIIVKRVSKKDLRRALVPRYRRAPFLISYWKENLLFFENYLSGKIVGASAETAEVLDFFDDWRTVEEMGRRWPQYTAQSLRSTVRQLAHQTLLERATGKHNQESELVRALRRWRMWNPAASFFHLSTKDAYSGEISEEEIRYVEELMKGRAAPRSTRRRVGAKIVELWSGPPSITSEFSRVLRARRTWREFSPAKVDQKSFGTLMELSFAVQQWQAIPNAGKFPLKTSPSGGSLHPLEAYVLARKVEGLTPGIYHYDAVGRRLFEVRRGATAAEIQKLLAGQWWFRDAAVVVFLTAVFGRTQWKYDYARAYRAILIEAGHLCQTFCLTASWLGLAPFCTVAMKDSAIEKALKVDGISESVIYAMGAGVRPAVTQRESAGNKIYRV